MAKHLDQSPYYEGNFFIFQLVPDKTGAYSLRIVAKGKTFEREKAFTFNAFEPKEEVKDVDKPQQEKVVEQPLDQEPAVTDGNSGISWKAVTIKFILLNLIIIPAVILYIKRDSLKGFIQSLFKRERS